jgi:hypothetical protein
MTNFPGLEQRETRGTRRIRRTLIMSNQPLINSKIHPPLAWAGNNAPGKTRESAIRYYIDRESSNVCRRFWGDIRKNLE